jgi:integrase
VYATKEQVATMASLAENPKVAAAIILLAYSGMRCGELLNPELTIHAGSFLIPDSKTGKPRKVPVAPTARAYTHELPIGLTYWQLNDAFAVVRKAAGVPKGLTLHGLRHTFASWMINGGCDLLTLATLLGHTTVYVTARYAHLYDSTLKSAVEALG